MRIANSDAEWKTKFDVIFSEDLSLRVWNLDPGFDYRDPDTTYEEDVQAFVNALQERVDDLEKTLG